MIKILFFASLREVLGVDQIDMPVDSPLSLEQLRLKIIDLHPAWKSELCKKNLLMSINKHFAKSHSLVNPDDEVAFFPPVTGG